MSLEREIVKALPPLKGFDARWPAVSLIAALNEKRVIGVGNQLPWKISEDLKLFRALTGGQPVIMGRKTYESIGKLLPERMNVIISRNPNYRVEGALVVDSLPAAILEARRGLLLSGAERPELFILGGGGVFRDALTLADRLYLTRVEHDVPRGDVFFPEWESAFQVVAEQPLPSSIPARFQLWERNATG